MGNDFLDGQIGDASGSETSEDGGNDTEENGDNGDTNANANVGVGESDGDDGTETSHESHESAVEPEGTPDGESGATETETTETDGSEGENDSTERSAFASMLDGCVRMNEVHTIPLERIEENVGSVEDTDLLTDALEHDHRDSAWNHYGEQLTKLGVDTEELAKGIDKPTEEELEAARPDAPGNAKPTGPDTTTDSGENIFDASATDGGEIGDGPYGSDDGGGVAKSTAFGNPDPSDTADDSDDSDDDEDEPKREPLGQSSDDEDDSGSDGGSSTDSNADTGDTGDTGDTDDSDGEASTNVSVESNSETIELVLEISVDVKEVD